MFCGPFQLLARVEIMVYHLALLANIKVHNVFHILLIKQYIHDPSHVIHWNVIQVELEDEFQLEALSIPYRKEIVL